jgi:hypothetical protein
MRCKLFFAIYPSGERMRLLKIARSKKRLKNKSLMLVKNFSDKLKLIEMNKDLGIPMCSKQIRLARAFFSTRVSILGILLL